MCCKCECSVFVRVQHTTFVVQDCTSPLFLAVAANEYRTASELIRKGAAVDVAKVYKCQKTIVTVHHQHITECQECLLPTSK